MAWLTHVHFRRWHLASFRCDAEFGRLSGHIGHRVAIKLDLWVRALVEKAEQVERALQQIEAKQ